LSLVLNLKAIFFEEILCHRNFRAVLKLEPGVARACLEVDHGYLVGLPLAVAGDDGLLEDLLIAFSLHYL